MTKAERMLGNRLERMERALVSCRLALGDGNLRRMLRQYDLLCKLKYDADTLLGEVMQDGDAG